MIDLPPAPATATTRVSATRTFWTILSLVLCVLVAPHSLANPSPKGSNVETTAPTHTDGNEGTYRLMRSAEESVRKLVQPEKPIKGAALTANIQRRGVLIEATRKDQKVLGLRLLHKTDATKAIRSIGNFNVAVEGDQPDVAVLDELLKRLETAQVELPWSKRPAPKKSLPEADIMKARDTIELANYKIIVGQREAGIKLLGQLPDSLPSSMVIDRAIAYRSVGMNEEMRAVLKAASLEGTYAVAADILSKSETAFDPSALGLKAKQACGYLSVLDVLNALKRYDDLLALAHEIRTLDPTCAGAWDAEFNEHTRRKDLEEARKVAKLAYTGDPKNRLNRLRYGSAMQRLERFADAATIYEAIARDFPDEKGILRLTLGVMLRDIPGRQGHKDRLSKRLDADSNDIVSQFLRGVLHHYENEFEASHRLLKPLQERLSYEQRIDIYLAMNDFNLGQKEKALARLNRAATAPMPDPDVFYCRAEILRDERREQAISDLERYLATSERSLVSNPGKQIRVKKMRDDLKRCLKDGTKTCVSDWEHPRHLVAPKPKDDSVRDEEERNYWPYAGLLILLIVTVLVWRKRLKG